MKATRSPLKNNVGLIQNDPLNFGLKNPLLSNPFNNNNLNGGKNENNNKYRSHSNIFNGCKCESAESSNKIIKERTYAREHAEFTSNKAI
jgi:hypothetical protein